MNREQEYRLSADNAFKRAVEEESAQLIVQWKILGAKYLELADQSKNIDARDTPNEQRSRFDAGPPDGPHRSAAGFGNTGQVDGIGLSHASSRPDDPHGFERIHSGEGV